MTTDVLEGQMSFDAIIAERDAEHRARRDLVAEDPQADRDYERFLSALGSAVDRSHPYYVSQNDVRVLLFEDTVDGPRCAINPKRFSGFYSRACKEGRITWDGYDICTTSPTGNNGKPQKRYRWIGGWAA